MLFSAIGAALCVAPVRSAADRLADVYQAAADADPNGEAPQSVVDAADALYTAAWIEGRAELARELTVIIAPAMGANQ